VIVPPASWQENMMGEGEPGAAPSAAPAPAAAPQPVMIPMEP